MYVLYIYVHVHSLSSSSMQTVAVLLLDEMFTNSSTGTSEKYKHSVPSVMLSCTDDTENVWKVVPGTKGMMAGRAVRLMVKSVVLSAIRQNLFKLPMI